MTWIIILIVIGLILFIVEVFFIPGTTVVGILGFILTALGVFLAYRQYSVMTGHITLAITVICIVTLMIIAAKSNLWTKLSNQSALEGRANEVETKDIQIGDTGIAIASIKPIGKARIHDMNYEVKSLGELINTGEKVEVIKISGNQIIVRQYKDIPSEQATT